MVGTHLAPLGVVLEGCKRDELLGEGVALEGPVSATLVRHESGGDVTRTLGKAGAPEARYLLWYSQVGWQRRERSERLLVRLEEVYFSLLVPLQLEKAPCASYTSTRAAASTGFAVLGRTAAKGWASRRARRVAEDLQQVERLIEDVGTTEVAGAVSNWLIAVSLGPHCIVSFVGASETRRHRIARHVAMSGAVGDADGG